MTDKKADLDGNGELSVYEKARGDAVQKAMDVDDPEAEEKIRHGSRRYGM